LAARFNRSQRDNCSIFPLICETPRGLPRLQAARRVTEKQRRKKKEICIREYRYIRVGTFCQYLYFNDMRHRVFLFLPHLAARLYGKSVRKKEEERERKKRRRKSKRDWMDG